MRASIEPGDRHHRRRAAPAAHCAGLESRRPAPGGGHLGANDWAVSFHR